MICDICRKDNGLCIITTPDKDLNEKSVCKDCYTNHPEIEYCNCDDCKSTREKWPKLQLTDWDK